MSKDDQKAIVTDLCNSIRDHLCGTINAGKVPEGWDGIELRQWLIDQTISGSGHYLKRKENRARARAYRNTVLVNNL